MRWIRKQVGWIAGTAIGGFLLWLVGTAVSLQTTQAESAGVLFGRKVPLSDYHRSLEATLRWAQLTYGDRAQAELPKEDLPRQAWERLMLLAEAKRLKIRVPDKEIIDQIQRQPLFLREGRFDRNSYQAIIQYQMGTTLRTFEEDFRDQLTIGKLFQQAIPEPRFTDEELRAQFLKRETKIRVSALALPSEPLAREIAEAARQQPEQLPRAARQLGLKITRSDLVKADALLPEGGQAGFVFEPLFAMEPGQIAGPLAGPKGWLVAKLEAKEPPEEKRFDELKENLRKELAARKRMGATLAWYQDLLKRADLKATRVPGKNPD